MVLSSTDVRNEVLFAITRVNDVRNDVAHTFFPQQRRRYVRGKKVVYDGVHLFTTAGLKRFTDDFNLAYEHLRKRLRAPYLEA